MINLGILGYGYWGPNLLRNFNDIKDINIRQVADIDKDKLSKLKLHYPKIEVTTISDDIITNSSIDAICIATPPSTHYDLAMKSLDAGKTWQHMGLNESHHIGRVLIHPKYPDIVLEGQLSFEEKTQNQGQAGNVANKILQDLKIS